MTLLFTFIDRHFTWRLIDGFNFLMNLINWSMIDNTSVTNIETRSFGSIRNAYSAIEYSKLIIVHLVVLKLCLVHLQTAFENWVFISDYAVLNECDAFDVSFRIFHIIQFKKNRAGLTAALSIAFWLVIRGRVLLFPPVYILIFMFA